MFAAANKSFARWQCGQVDLPKTWLPMNGVSNAVASMTVWVNTPRLRAIPWDTSFPFTKTIGACHPPFTSGSHHFDNQSCCVKLMSIPCSSFSMQSRMTSSVKVHSPHGILTLNGPHEPANLYSVISMGFMLSLSLALSVNEESTNHPMRAKRNVDMLSLRNNPIP